MNSTYTKSIFTENIDKNDINIIFELGSRDLEDSQEIQKFYGAKVYSFECNPDSLVLCNENKIKFNNENIILVEKEISDKNGVIDFRPFDLNVYNNMGASSIFEIFFTNRAPGCSDKDRIDKVQTKIEVESTRIDTFCIQENISKIDMICMDLQEAELLALMSCGNYLKNIKYIITEASSVNTYKGGCTFDDIKNYLNDNGFDYICSDNYKYEYPTPVKTYNFFNCLFKNRNI